MTKLMSQTRDKIMAYQFLTAFPQMISRIQHPSQSVQDVLVGIVARVIRAHPLQSLWPIVGAMLSRRKERQALTEKILLRAQVSSAKAGLQLTTGEGRSRACPSRQGRSPLVNVAAQVLRGQAVVEQNAGRNHYAKLSLPSVGFPFVDDPSLAGRAHCGPAFCRAGRWERKREVTSP